jgi:starch-binding outer membrane protein SusE/F
LKQQKEKNMKRVSIYKLFAILFSVAVLTVACTEELEQVRLDPDMSTSDVANIKANAADVTGFIIAAGKGITEKGVCYNTSPNPTVDNNKVAYTGDAKTATFVVTLTGLNYTTKYYARAYAMTEGGVIYGEETSFTTTPALPVVGTVDITDIASSSAKGGGAITDKGGADITARGIVYGTVANPTLENSKTVETTTENDFQSLMKNLKGSTTYYVRAYATNSAGTGYGPVKSFVTLAPVVPTVTTAAVTNILGFTATGGGEITDEGGATVTKRGVVYSTTANPTVASSKTENGEGMGTFTSPLTGLDALTTYYIRAYAENSAGIGYGPERTFKTLAPIRTWYVPGNYVAASYPGGEFADWSPDKSPIIKSTESAPDNLEGYVYMKNNAMFKFTNQPNWGGTNYGDGGAGLLSATGGDIAMPAGYYKFNVNANTLAYTAVATVWGVVGSATPGSWNSDSPLTYDPLSRTWRGGVTMTAEEFKFRANNNWDYNYGAPAGSANLEAGGPNIKIDVASDYYVILNLSTPHEYKFSANRWGLIGSATPGGWSDDTDLTWDPVTGSMMVTLNLIAGEFKFRANDGWAINLGGTTTSLTQDGPNISVAEAGNYTINLYLTATGGTYTIKKN